MGLVNRGAKLLGALLAERGAQKRLADELGIDQGYLSRIASGERIPGLDARRKLKPLGIDLEAWDEPSAENDADDDAPDSDTKPTPSKGSPVQSKAAG
jgi:transcriptional regulator with XRE-family HTH domain